MWTAIFMCVSHPAPAHQHSSMNQRSLVAREQLEFKFILRLTFSSCFVCVCVIVSTFKAFGSQRSPTEVPVCQLGDFTLVLLN